MDDWKKEWETAARAAVANAPPLSERQRRELTHGVMRYAAKKRARETVAAMESERQLRHLKRLLCERYLAGEITRTWLNRRLKELEDRHEGSRPP